MMGYILLLLLLINMSSFISIMFNKKIELTFILSIVFQALFLYLFGIAFNNLLIGFHFLIGINIISFIIMMVKIIKNRQLLQLIIRPSLFIIIVVFLLFSWASFSQMATVWDEFSHWALSAKNMFMLNNLGTGLDSTIVAKSYLSGTSIFQYYCLKLFGEYKESVLFLSMSIFTISPLFILLTNVNKLKEVFSIKTIFSVLIIFFLPLLVIWNAYSSLYVDATLGIYFFVALYYCFCIKKKSFFDYLFLSTILSALIIIKDFGFVLSLLVFLIMSFMVLFSEKLEKKSMYVKKILVNILILLPSLLIRYSWIFFLSLYGEKSGISSNTFSLVISSYKKIFMFNTGDYRLKVLCNFIREIFNGRMVDSFINISIAAFLIIFIFTMGYIYSKSKKDQKRFILCSIISSLLGFLGYSIIVFSCYISIFSEYEALRLASFNRYFSPYIIGLLLLMVISIIKNINTKKCICVLFLVVFFSLQPISYLSISLLAPQSWISSKNIRERYVNLGEKVKKIVKKEDSVFIVSRCSDGFDFWVMRYELTPIKTNKNNFPWSIGNICYESDQWSSDYEVEDFWNLVNKDYDYIILLNIDDYFENKYSSMFNTKLNSDQIYRIVKNTKSKFHFELEE